MSGEEVGLVEWGGEEVGLVEWGGGRVSGVGRR